ncbi:thimet oligopeptidase [Stipitochalara longipes BDJ]|nr:thimet oligopeptidase [Stipitochalara longipes BDJ]
MASAPIRIPPQLPLAFTHTPSNLISLTNTTIASSSSLLNQILSTNPSTATFQNAIFPLIHNENNNTNTAVLASFYKYISPSASLREASITYSQLWEDYWQELESRKELFEAFRAVYEKDEQLDEEERWFVESEYRGLLRNGAGIAEGEEKERQKVVVKRITEICAQCGRNIREEKGGVWFSGEELDGVPKDVVARFKRGEVESENQGKYWVSFKAADYLSCMEYAVKEKTRKFLWSCRREMCAENVELMKELIVLRAEQAELLGFESHADYKTQEKMLSAQTAMAFLDQLQEEITPVADVEMDEVRKFKRNHLLSQDCESNKLDNRLYLWDTSFYSRLMKETQVRFDETQLSEYFSLYEVIRGLLRTFETLFGLVFEEIKEEGRKLLMEKQEQPVEATTWHESVMMFSVWNEEAMGGDFLGYLYLDLLQRDGKKDHPCKISISAGHEYPDGTKHYPSTLLLTSFPAPTLTKPTLLHQRNIKTAFHELGHGIHDLIPSKMLENWCWDPSILHTLSRHYSYLSPEYKAAWQAENPKAMQPPEKAPLELLKEFAKTRNMRGGSRTRGLLATAKFDFAGEMDLGEIYQRVRREATGFWGLDGSEGWGAEHTRTEHLFQGYDVGLYSYVVAEVYASDLFETKFDGKLMNGEEGRKYRRMILEKARNGRESKMLEEYLGRKPKGGEFSRALEK